MTKLLWLASIVGLDELTRTHLELDDFAIPSSRPMTFPAATWHLSGVHHLNVVRRIGESGERRHHVLFTPKTTGGGPTGDHGQNRLFRWIEHLPP